MAKRFQAPKEFGRSVKKPKLDISINKGRKSISSQYQNFDSNLDDIPTHSRNVVTNSVQNVINNIEVACTAIENNNIDHLWDDGDDDVILLATQVAETQAAAKVAATQVEMSCVTEVTFNEFRPKLGVSTSTQRPKIDHKLLEEADILSQMLNDDDDGDFAILSAMDTVKKESSMFKKPMTSKNNRHIIEKEQHDDIFVSQLTSSKYIGNEATTIAKPDETKYNAVQLIDSKNTENQTAARLRLASERQIQFLKERLEAAMQQNQKLNTDLNETKAKMECKEGEAALLRDEMRHMKQQVSNLKMEKILSAETAKTESKSKIAELSKQVEAKDTELQLKSVEYSMMKMRHADETKRLEMSVRNESQFPIINFNDAPKTTNGLSSKEKRSLMRLRALNINHQKLSNEMNSDKYSELFYKTSNQRNITQKHRTIFQSEFEILQPIVAKLQMLRDSHHLEDRDILNDSNKIIESICKVFTEFWTYVHNLEYAKNCSIHPYHGYRLECDDSWKIRKSLIQPDELFNEENTITLRRYIATLAIVCQLIPDFAKHLIEYKHGEYKLLQIACEAINSLSYSTEVVAHFGVLEAFAKLLHMLLLNVISNEDKHYDDDSIKLLMSLLKELVFARPSAWIFHQLSYCLIDLLQLPSALEMLCVDSDRTAFYSDRICSVHRFTNDSCILQVYAGLLEIAFPLNVTLTGKKMQLLCAICLNYLRFAHACLTKPSNFVQRHLPPYDEEDEDFVAESESTSLGDGTNSNSANSLTASMQDAAMAPPLAATSTNSTLLKQLQRKKSCECYTKLSLSVLTLVFQVLKQWLLTDKKNETSLVIKISKIAVQLFFKIFCDFYIRSLLRYNEDTTKHYLSLLITWWEENKVLLQFNDVQMYFLNKIKTSHIMPKSMLEDASKMNIREDLAAWYRKSKDLQSSESVSESSVYYCKHLMDNCMIDDKFFQAFEGYAFNFQ